MALKISAFSCMLPLRGHMGHVQYIETDAQAYKIITDKTVIKNALERVIHSAEFKDSERSKKLLEYIVERHLDGYASQINGTTIAQDVLGHGEDFDPSTNPVVRVQAGRLRKLLAKYYRRSGKDDVVLIYVAKGQYAPQFGTRVKNTAKGSTSKKIAEPQKQRKKWIGAAIFSIVAISAIAFAIIGRTPIFSNASSIEKTVSKYPSIVILPFQNLTGDPENDVFKQGFQHQLASDLYQFRVIRITLSEQAHSQIINAKNKVADYSLEGTFLSVKDDIDLIVRLIDLTSGETLKQHRISRAIDDDSYFNALTDISSDLSSQFAGPEGILVKQSLKDIRANLDFNNHQHANLKAFECLTIFHQFEADKTIENFNHADGCLQYQVKRNPKDSSLLAALSWINVYGSAESAFFDEAQLNNDYTLGGALELAERAVTLNPGNNLAYEYMALIQWRTGKKQAAIQSIRRAIQLNSAAPSQLSNLSHF